LVSLEELGDKTDGKILKLISHMILINQNWLCRLRGEPNIDIIRQLSLAESRQVIASLKNQWQTYFEKLNASQFSQKKAYQNFKGHSYETVVSDILAHIVGHASYHREQIAGLVRKANGIPADTDFITFA
jgi:uncharacterized damage-inducible protein DinB